MTVKIFQDILTKAASTGIDSRSLETRTWFRNKAKEIRKVDTKRILATAEGRYRSTVVPGSMYMFYYQPKYREELPYYDTFPLIFPLTWEKESFLGINVHYLQPVLRAKLMDQLYTYISNDKLSDKAKLDISYKILKNASSFNLVKPCIKRYLKPQVRSRFVKVMPNEWDMCLLLPTQNFVKATPNKVWQESRMKAGL